MKNLYLLGALILYLTGNAQCITNGNFELGVTANYTFRTNPVNDNFSQVNCDVNTTGFEVFTMSPLTNQFQPENVGGTLVEAASGEAYGPFDETLFNLGTFVYRVSPVTGGTKAMKLNNSYGGGADINTMSVEINNAPQNIMFDYSVVTQIHLPYDPLVQPFFTARLYDITTGILIPGSFCFKADPSSPLFTTTFSGDHQYTDWQCGSLSVPAAYVGKNLRLEFVMADCGQGGHFGTVYLDNIRCGTTCNIFGEIALNDIQVGCPEQPFSVCGSFVNPSNSTIISNSITLNIVDNNGNTTPLALIPIITGNTFCFTVNSVLFDTLPSEEFDFTVSANFQGPTGIVNLWGVSSSVHPDVTFRTIDPQDASIDSSNTLYWPDIDEVYTLEFISDNECCPLSKGSARPDRYYTTTINNSFISIGEVLAHLATNTTFERCFRWRVKTKCGWSGWCCLATPGLIQYPDSGPVFSNVLAPNCYEENLCENTIIILNIPENIVANDKMKVVDKQISIVAHNLIEAGGQGVYRAGNFIELSPTFTAVAGSIFTATIEECVGAGAPANKSSSRTNMDSEGMRNMTNVIVPETFIVYPNPTKGLINITGKSAKVFTVIDINGKELIRVENKDNSKEFRIDLSRLNSGIYFLTADVETIQKVIKE